MIICYEGKEEERDEEKMRGERRGRGGERRERRKRRAGENIRGENRIEIEERPLYFICSYLSFVVQHCNHWEYLYIHYQEWHIFLHHIFLD
jgi:hypothetical protein